MRKIISYLLILVALSYGENFSQLESKYLLVANQLKTAQARLDSLQMVMINFTEKLNADKSKGELSHKKLANHMERAQELSLAIENQREIIAKNKKQILDLSSALEKKYAKAIDSLQSLQNSESNKNAKLQLEYKILELLEKRFIISPNFERLSFDPQKIKDIDLSKVRDTLELSIYKEYLNKAGNEINKYLARIRDSREEIEDVLTLQKKTQRFIEEVDDNRMIGSITKTQSAKDASPLLSNNNVGGSLKNLQLELSLKAQIQSLLYFINRLSLNDSEILESNWKEPIDSSSVNLSPQEYILLLKRLETILEEYQNKIKEKSADSRIN